MNKEIKFRVWDADEGFPYRMSEPFAPWDGIIKFLEPRFDSIPIQFAQDTSRFTWMQYTGLKDKNASPIYESDVVHRAGMIKHYQVVWNAKGCGWSIENSQQSMAMSDLCILTVVGNIFETPDLLEPKS